MNKGILPLFYFVSNATRDTFKDLRQRIQNFLLHFIADCVFDSDKAPDRSILTWIIDYIVQREKTKEMDLFDHKVVVVPDRFLKSVLLKLILRFAEQQEGREQEEQEQNVHAQDVHFITEELNLRIKMFAKEKEDFECKKFLIIIKDCYEV